jgi:Kef-type K+ transport system membrane component KefB
MPARIGTRKGRIMAMVAMFAGLISVLNSSLNLATAEGGPGTGNGVVGSAMSIVLGAIGIVLGAVAFYRSIRITNSNKNQN